MWCEAAEFHGVIACVDLVSVVSYIAYVKIEGLLNECLGTTCL